ncbi:MAG: Hsp33 family molecular chaperone HslO [Bacteroidetes bacterium]|nr:MAG: Hsp33 family molecular chaperone HslO [Bacteroidota bacterium]
MELNEIKSKFLNADRIITILDKKARFRASFIRNSSTVKTSQEKHNLAQFPAALLAKYLTSASLISSFLKGEERIILDISSDGLLEKVFAEAMPIGEVRGFIRYGNHSDSALKKMIQNGFFKLSKILYDKGEPVTGIIEINSENVEDIIEDYFANSEQVPTFIKLETGFDDNNIIKSSAGILVQSLPGVSLKELNEVRTHIKNIRSLNNSLNGDNDLTNSLQQYLPFDFDVIKTSRVDFFCRCSKNNFISKLYTLPVEEIESMHSEHQNELVCQFCNAHYYLSNDDFTRIINDLKAKKN